MGLGQNRRKVNMKDEYYVSGLVLSFGDERKSGSCYGRGLLGIKANNCAETTGEGPRGLGAEACQAPAWRAGRHPCINFSTVSYWQGVVRYI